MKVKLLTLMSGPEGIFHPGAVVDFSEEKAQALVEGGFAEFVQVPRRAEVIETATQPIEKNETTEAKTAKNEKAKKK